MFFVSEWLPVAENYDPDSEAERQIILFRTLLEQARSPSNVAIRYPPPNDDDAAIINRALQMTGVKVGDKVMVGGIKAGVLRYCGKTGFSEGRTKSIKNLFLCYDKVMNYLGVLYCKFSTIIQSLLRSDLTHKCRESDHQTDQELIVCKFMVMYGTFITKIIHITSTVTIHGTTLHCRCYASYRN